MAFKYAWGASERHHNSRSQAGGISMLSAFIERISSCLGDVFINNPLSPLIYFILKEVCRHSRDKERAIGNIKGFRQK
jgi:hypothetical protein